MTTTSATVVAAVAVGLPAAGPAAPCRAQASAPTAWAVGTIDLASGLPVGNVFLSFPDQQATRITNDQGLTPGPDATGTVRVRATRLGYADMDTTVVVPDDGSVVTLALRRSAVALAPSRWRQNAE